MAGRTSSRWNDARIRRLLGQVERLRAEVAAVRPSAPIAAVTSRRARAGAWTEQERRFLADHFDTMSHAEIAERLGRTEAAVKGFAQKVGLVRVRRWPRADLERVRAAGLTVSAAELARELGRTERSIHQARFKLGMARRIAPGGEALDAFVRDCHALGWSDRETAEAWSAKHPGCRPVDRHRVAVVRDRLGLPDNALSDHRRRLVAAKTAEQLKAAGLPSIGYLRVEAFRRRAIEAGWPEDLGPRHVQILNALWDNGPMTRREIAGEIGMPWKGSRASLHSNDPEGSYLAHLMARGMVVCFGRVVRRNVPGPRGGQGKNVSLYSLAPTIERKVSDVGRAGETAGERVRAVAGVAGGDPPVDGAGDRHGEAEGGLRQAG